MSKAINIFLSLKPAFKIHTALNISIFIQDNKLNVLIITKFNNTIKVISYITCQLAL